jgi:hypothetical protein
LFEKKNMLNYLPLRKADFQEDVPCVYSVFLFLHFAGLVAEDPSFDLHIMEQECNNTFLSPSTLTILKARE